MTPRRIANGRFYALTGLVYALLIGLYLCPLWLMGRECYIGVDSNDLFNEIILSFDVSRQLRAGHLPLFSDLLAYPHQYSLLGGFKSYLHTLASLPFQALLPWPHWWNATVALALWGNALMTALALHWLTRRRGLSAALGALTIFSMWNSYGTMEGHLAQMWYGPLLLAVAALRQVLAAEQPRAVWPWDGAIWTLLLASLAAALIYWPHAAFLALLAGLWLTWHRWRLSAARWTQLGLVALAGVSLLAPLARLVCDYSEDIIDLNLFAESAEGAYGRAFSNSMGFPSHLVDVCVPCPDWALTALVLAALLALAVWGWRRHGETELWVLTLALVLLFGAGPCLSWGGYTLCQSPNHPLYLPFHYLQGLGGLFSRWQQPWAVTPLVMVALYAAALHSLPSANTLPGVPEAAPTPSVPEAAPKHGEPKAVPKHGEPKAVPSPGESKLGPSQSESEAPLSPSVLSQARILAPAPPLSLVAILLWLAVLGSSLLVALDRGALERHIAAVNRTYATGAYTAIPCSDCPRLGHLEALAQLPAGAVLDWPLYYSVNAWHYAFLHGHPQMNTQPFVANVVGYPEAQDLADNGWLLYALQEQTAACAPATPAPPPNAAAVGLRYGEFPLLLDGERDEVAWQGAWAHLDQAGHLTEEEAFRGMKRLQDLGVKYLLLHRSTCHWICPAKAGQIYRHLREVLGRAGAQMVVEDAEASLWRWPNPPSNQGLEQRR